MPPRGSKKVFNTPIRLASAEISDEAKIKGVEPHQLGLSITTFDYLRMKELAILRNQSMTYIMQEIIGQALDISEHTDFIATEAAITLQDEIDRTERRLNY
jgi:hypothetical protein